MKARAIWSFAGLALSVLLGVLIGAGSYTAIRADATSYLSNDPTACINCHIMQDQYDGWLKASHHAVATCNDCHVPHHGLAKWYVKAENGYHHSKAFTLENFHEPIRMRDESRAIVNANCIECHGQHHVRDRIAPPPSPPSRWIASVVTRRSVTGRATEQEPEACLNHRRPPPSKTLRVVGAADLHAGDRRGGRGHSRDPHTAAEHLPAQA